MAHKLTVVIVSYNVKYYLEQCLVSLRRALTGIDAEVTAYFVLLGIQLYAHEFQAFTCTPAGTCLILADTTGKYHDIHTTQSSGIGTDIFLDAVEVHFFSQNSLRIAGSYGIFQVAHVTGFTEDTQHTALLVQQVGDAVGIQTLFLHDEGNGTGINITTAGTHHQTFQRGQAHAGVYTLTVLDGSNGTTVANVASDDFLSFRLYT